MKPGREFRPMLQCSHTRFSENAYTCKRSRVLAKNYVIFKARTPRVTYLDVDGAVRVEGVVYPVQGDVDVRHRVQQFNQESRRYWRIHFGGHKADRQKIQTDRQALTDFFSAEQFLLTLPVLRRMLRRLGPDEEHAHSLPGPQTHRSQHGFRNFPLRIFHRMQDFPRYARTHNSTGALFSECSTCHFSH